MTSTVTASTLIALIKDTVSTATAEACLVQARLVITLEGQSYGITLPDWTTTTPLLGTFTDGEAAALITVAIAVFSQNYKNSGASSSSGENANIGGIIGWGSNSSNSNSNSGSGASNINVIAKSVVISLMRVQHRQFLRA